MTNDDDFQKSSFRPQFAVRVALLFWPGNTFTIMGDSMKSILFDAWIYFSFFSFFFWFDNRIELQSRLMSLTYIFSGRMKSMKLSPKKTKKIWIQFFIFLFCFIESSITRRREIAAVANGKMEMSGRRWPRICKPTVTPLFTAANTSIR